MTKYEMRKIKAIAETYNVVVCDVKRVHTDLKTLRAQLEEIRREWEQENGIMPDDEINNPVDGFPDSIPDDMFKLDL